MFIANIHWPTYALAVLYGNKICICTIKSNKDKSVNGFFEKNIEVLINNRKIADYTKLIGRLPIAKTKPIIGRLIGLAD